MTVQVKKIVEYPVIARSPAFCGINSATKQSPDPGDEINLKTGTASNIQEISIDRMTEKEIKSILNKGEGLTIEFKSSFNTEVIETLVAFANTMGGSVLIGISNDLKLIGVSINSESIQNWLNEIKSKTSPSIIPDAEIVTIDLKKIVVFSIQEFPIKPVALKGKYYKRVANSNHLLSTSEVVNMHLQSFNTSWDYHTNNQFSIKDISFEKVQHAIDRLNRAGGHITEDPLSFLIKMRPGTRRVNYQCCLSLV